MTLRGYGEINSARVLLPVAEKHPDVLWDGVHPH